MRGWLAPIQIALHLCELSELTRSKVDDLVSAGSFKSKIHASYAIYLYSVEWKEIVSSTPITSVIAWARGNVDVALAESMASLLTEYTKRLLAECGLQYLPPSLQRQSHRIFGHNNPLNFRIITEGLTGDQLAQFPDKIEGDIFNPISVSFGRVTREDKSWFYDIERKCTVVCKDKSMELIPELRVAVAPPRDEFFIGPDSTLTIWFPFHSSLRGKEIEIGRTLQLTESTPVFNLEIVKLRIRGDERHFMFHVVVEEFEDELSSKIIFFDALQHDLIYPHPINWVDEEVRVDGGYALGVTDDDEGFAVPLVEGAAFEGHYPDAQPSRVVVEGHYLVDRTLDVVIEDFRECLEMLHDTEKFDLVYWRHRNYSEEQKQLFKVFECVYGNDPKSAECKDAIAVVLNGKPDSRQAIESAVASAFGYVEAFTMTTLDQLLTN